MIPGDDQRFRLARQGAERFSQRQNACLSQTVHTVVGLQTQYADPVLNFDLKKLSG